MNALLQSPVFGAATGRGKHSHPAVLRAGTIPELLCGCKIANPVFHPSLPWTCSKRDKEAMAAFIAAQQVGHVHPGYAHPPIIDAVDAFNAYETMLLMVPTAPVLPVEDMMTQWGPSTDDLRRNSIAGQIVGGYTGQWHTDFLHGECMFHWPVQVWYRPCSQTVASYEYADGSEIVVSEPGLDSYVSVAISPAPSSAGRGSDRYGDVVDQTVPPSVVVAAMEAIETDTLYAELAPSIQRQERRAERRWQIVPLFSGAGRYRAGFRLVVAGRGIRDCADISAVRDVARSIWQPDMDDPCPWECPAHCARRLTCDGGAS